MPSSFAKSHKGVKVDKVHPNIFAYLKTLPPHLQKKIIITSGNDSSVHSSTSRHYKNLAIDAGFDQEVWDYIVTDPKRHQYGLVLVDPNHGTGKHIHLSYGYFGTEPNMEVDKEGRQKVLATGNPIMDLQTGKPMDMTNLASSVKSQITEKKTETSNWLDSSMTPLQYQPEPVEFNTNPLPRMVTALQPSQGVIDYSLWNQYGWLDGQYILSPEEQDKQKPNEPSEDELVSTLLSSVKNPTLRKALELTYKTTKNKNTNRRNRSTSNGGGGGLVDIPQVNEDTPQIIPTSPVSGGVAPTSFSAPPTSTASNSPYTPPAPGTYKYVQPIGSNKSPSKTRYNVGNLRSSDGGFNSYNSYEEGRQALEYQLYLYQSGKTKTGITPDYTILQAMNVYAPKEDRNNPKQYAKFVADYLGVSPDTPIRNLDIKKWADAIEVMEGHKDRKITKEFGGWLDAPTLYQKKIAPNERGIVQPAGELEILRINDETSKQNFLDSTAFNTMGKQTKKWLNTLK